MKLAIMVGMLPSPMTDVDDADAAVSVYQAVLSDLPPWAVEKACDAALRGKVGSSGGRFRPTPGEMHDAAEKFATEVAREKAQIDRVLLASVQEERLSPEQRAAAVARVRGLAASVSKSSAMPKNEKAILDAGGRLDDLGMVKPPADDHRTEKQRRDEAEANLERMAADGFVPKPSKDLLEKIGTAR